MLTFGLETRTELGLMCSCRFWPVRWHNQNLFNAHKMPKGCSLWPKVKLKICFAGAVKRIYSTYTIRWPAEKGANGFKSARGDEAARRHWLCLNIKSHAEESWFVQYGKVWYMLWQRMADVASMFGFWAPPAPLQYTRTSYMHFANTIRTIQCGKRCAAVTGSSCGRVATCHATRFTAYVSLSLSFSLFALGGIGSGRAVHIRSAPG